MNGVPWWLAVPSVAAVLTGAGFTALAVRIKLNGPAVAARWRAAVEAEKARSRVLEEAMR